MLRPRCTQLIIAFFQGPRRVYFRRPRFVGWLVRRVVERVLHTCLYVFVKVRFLWHLVKWLGNCYTSHDDAWRDAGMKFARTCDRRIFQVPSSGSMQASGVISGTRSSRPKQDAGRRTCKHLHFSRTWCIGASTLNGVVTLTEASLVVASALGILYTVNIRLFWPPDSDVYTTWFDWKAVVGRVYIGIPCIFDRSRECCQRRLV